LLTIVNLLLCRTGIWLPIGIALFVAAGLASLGALWLGYGAGLEQFGSGVLRRLGRPYAGAIASRAAGAGTLTVLKCIPILGFAVVLFEVGMALSGFGASVETGFGTSRGWLASRMRPQTDPSL
jgi:hypothetical protein